MGWHLAPALVQLLKETNQRWPHRPKGSDGTVGDTSHAARQSDHNPNSRGSVNALDVTYPGVDPAVLIAAVKRHPSANYVIFNRKIYTRSNGWKAEPYHGASPHTEHLHVSILQNATAEKDTTPWIAGVGVKPTKPVATKPKLPRYPGARALRVGSQGDAVKVVQLAVGQKVTGTMSVGDVAKVRAFQKVRPWLWPADGVIGPKTFKALGSSSRVKKVYR